MRNHAVVILLLRTIFIIVTYSKYSLALDFKYPIRNITALISEQNLQQFTSKQRGNFTLMVTWNDFLYVVSNGNELLKVSKKTLEVADTFSGKLHCVENEICDQRNINLVNPYKEGGILWYCFAHMTFSNNAYKEELPFCHLTLEDSFSKIQGQWQAQTFTSSDFQHRTVSLTKASFVYVGLYDNGQKQLRIFKNPLTFAPAYIQIKPIGLSQDFLKGPGDFLLVFQDKFSTYFLFLETDSSCGFRNPQLQTRLLRVCNDDLGASYYGPGKYNEFNSMAKINVNCQSKSVTSNSAAHTFTIASAAVWMALTRELVVSFINKRNEASSSLICVYSIQSIEDAFNSDLQKATEKPSYIRNDFPDTCANFSTMIFNKPYLLNVHTTSKTYPLRKKSISNITIFQEHDSKILHLSADQLLWSKYRLVILFIGIEYPTQSAIIIISLEPTFCILEKILSMAKITMLELKRDDKPVLYIGMSDRMVLLPLDRCNLNKDTCSLSFHPYCGWNEDLKMCSYISKESELRFFVQTINICPQVSKDIIEMKTKLDRACRLFSVTNPLKQIGTCTCKLINSAPEKMVISTKNICQMDGDWSPFSQWSDCSVTCGSGIQTRIRNCDHPMPENGGSNCEGSSSETRPCETKIECKKKIDVSGELAMFTSWSSWSQCSNMCGFAYKTRNRKCLVLNCVADASEKKLCQLPNCRNSIKSDWSKWSTFNQTDLSTKRFRFQCTWTSFYQSSSMTIVLFSGNNASRTCRNDECLEKSIKKKLNSELTLWSAWSNCSASCGAGIKIRSRQCTGEKCFGSTKDILQCNTYSCKSLWSCWSAWVGCSSLCETQKTRTRSRHCIYDKMHNTCNGPTSEEQECSLISCTSAYSQWTLWSSCRHDGVMVRTRKCKSKRQCLFPLLQSKGCARASTDKPVLYNSMYMIISGIVGFLVGGFVASIICYLWWRCTMNVIRKTHSSSLRISNPLQTDEIYNSQSLNTLPDSTAPRYRSTSNCDSYYQTKYCPPFREDSELYAYSPAPSFFEHRTPFSAQKQPLPHVQENEY